MTKPGTLRIPLSEVQETLYEILLHHHFPDDKAKTCTEVFAGNSLDGVYSHGINRFARFVSLVRKGLVLPDRDPVRKGGFGGMEQWDGQCGIGITNAIICTERAMEIAREFGMGCVALANTNHWMRAGTYARMAAMQGCVFIGWTNTVGNTPPWGAVDPRLGNNPLAIGVPFQGDAIVLDMAMSQFSYGALDLYRMKGEKLPVPGGFDEHGNLTDDPEAILRSQRTMPVGYWKGSGLSLLLDILAAVFSGGLSVAEISKLPVETRLSQVFIAFNLKSFQHHERIPAIVQQIIDDFHSAAPVQPNNKPRYPGERMLTVREENLRSGVPVLKEVWDEILNLK